MSDPIVDETPSSPRRVPASAEVTSPEAWTDAALQSLKDQLAPVITTIHSDGKVLSLAIYFDDINS